VDAMLTDTDTAELHVSADEIGSSLRVFAFIIDAKHKYTAGHSERVSKYGVRLAMGLDLPREQALQVRYAGLLHDVGKASVPSSLLDKEASLTEYEYARVKKHPLLTIEVLGTISSLAVVAPIAGGHHERYDGSGYPLGLKGDEIPIGARILAVADAFDAITSDRAYRKAQNPINAIRIIEENSGSQFDPRVVAAAPLLIE
ncbi:MAG: HD-GYP domain-containing protein, partial [Actinomycetota bacterium]